jgi:hypothetical protein
MGPSDIYFRKYIVLLSVINMYSIGQVMVLCSQCDIKAWKVSVSSVYIRRSRRRAPGLRAQARPAQGENKKKRLASRVGIGTIGAMGGCPSRRKQKNPPSEP